MRYHALAADYDGTLAHDGAMTQETADSLKRLKLSGRKLIMVTGRELEHLFTICPYIDLFDRIVAENGALLYNPADKSIRTLGEAPPTDFIEALQNSGVTGISVGHVIVATWEPHQHTALALIQEHGLDLQVIFNKGAVMLLPSGVNKASGLLAALTELDLSPHNVVGVGDAENDHAFLSICECAVAVANALPAVSERCDWTTPRPRGEGVCDLVERLITDDLQQLASQLLRHHIELGETDHKDSVSFPPYGVNIMICGTSGSGKSTLTVSLLEQLVEHGYQLVVMDPEGDYETIEFMINLGTAASHPSADEVLQILKKPDDSVSVNLLGMTLDDRPAYFNALLLQLLEMRANSGRPHWLIVDEAHHMLPIAWEHTNNTLPSELKGMIYITVHPQSVSQAVLNSIDIVIAVGEQPRRTVLQFCEAVGAACPSVPPIEKLQKYDVVVWQRGKPDAVLVHSRKSTVEHKRHWRKYAEGNLTPDRSFYFRGPDDKLNLRANNLMIFLQMADGVDDETWLYHLKRGDYSKWFQGAVRDDELAQEAAEIEQRPHLSAEDGRAAIRAIIEKRYTKPAENEVRL